MLDFLRQFRFRFNRLTHRRRWEAEMKEELNQHLEERERVLRDAGLASADARLEASKALGGRDQIEEACRDERCFGFLESLRADLKISLRQLGKNPGFAAALIAMIFLGLGVMTFVFSIAAPVVLLPQPYPQPEQLFQLALKDKKAGTIDPWALGLHWRTFAEQVNVFSSYTVARAIVSNVVIEGSPLPAQVVGISEDSFVSLGLQTVLGRKFLSSEFVRGADHEVILTYAFWVQHFGGREDILGQTVLIDEVPCTVVGVFSSRQPYPTFFAGGEIFRPLFYDSDLMSAAQGMAVFGRLKPGVSIGAAEQALNAVKLPPMADWIKSYLASKTMTLTTLTANSRVEAWWVMLVAGALIYLIAGLNAANLTLVRLLGRQREFAIRFSLGATRWRVIRLVALESFLLCGVAGLMAAAASRWIFPVLTELVTGWRAAHFWDTWDWHAVAALIALTFLAVAALIAVAVGRVGGEVSPAALKLGAGSGREMPRTNRLRGSLIAIQSAFAVLLLAGTGLMIRSFQQLRQAQLGFETENRVKVTIAFPINYNPPPAYRLQLFVDLADRMKRLPGVEAVTYGQDSLLVGTFVGTGRVKMLDGSFLPAGGNFVAENYAAVTGMHLKRGRWLSGRKGDFEVVINETLARARYGEANPVGQMLEVKTSTRPFIVVGVVDDVKESVRSPAGPRMYSPHWIYPGNLTTLVLRTVGKRPEEFYGQIRRSIYEVDPKLIADAKPVDLIVQNSLWAERNAFQILRALSGVALGLALLGTFAIMAFSVGSRGREFGVRCALGATPASLRNLVLVYAISSVGFGIGLGLIASIGLTRFMQSLLFETSPNDPIVYTAVATMMILSAVVAGWWPARQASRANPAKLLRTE